jgi:hypothetical protein
MEQAEQYPAIPFALDSFCSFSGEPAYFCLLEITSGKGVSPSDSTALTAFVSSVQTLNVPIEKPQYFPSSSVSAGLLLFGLMGLSLQRYIHPRHWLIYLKGFYSNVGFFQWESEFEPGKFPRFLLGFISVQCFALGFIFSLPWIRQLSMQEAIEPVIRWSVIILVLPLMRAMLISGLGSIYGISRWVNVYLQLGYQLHFMVGFTAFVPAAFMLWKAFSHETIIPIILILLFVLWGIYLVRIISMYKHRVKFPFVYLVLYLCTLEVLPIIWILYWTALHRRF